MAEQRINLTREILSDLLRHKVQLILVVLVLVAAFSVIVITNQTRIAISQQNKQLMHQDKLDDEWRHLLLEDSALAEHSRISFIARTKLQMVRPAPKQERIITER
ncbi:cell division protein FtsL [Dongshaea marina]|uniref:cell division protein FtsL n=1 Tax=Dongshaea marina TaxID=2047966 RepID=UPI000D3E790F|nr:cell division protein FtsL [Dongshaea marina]